LKANFPSDAEARGVEKVGDQELCSFPDYDSVMCSVFTKNKWPNRIIVIAPINNF